MSERLTPRIVRIEFQTGKTGLIYATSPDIQGLLVARESMPDLEAAIPVAITAMYAALGEQVVVKRLVGDEPDDNESWVVALPTATVGARSTDARRQMA